MNEADSPSCNGSQRIQQDRALLLRAYDEIRSKRSSLGGKLSVLLITGVLFVVIAGFSWSVVEVAILVGVLLLHEAGHAAGMLAFGFEDISFFFLPGFGAAVSGRKRTAPSWQRAVVSLLGPLPGVFVGFVLLLLNRSLWEDPTVQQVVVFLLGLNLFNMLPLVPLDGGHFFNYILFCRSVYLESAFTVAGSLGLGVFAVWSRDPLFGSLAFLLLIGGIHTMRVRRIVRELAGEIPADENEVGEEILLRIDSRVQARMEMIKKPKDRARIVHQIIEQAAFQPPGASTSLLLFLLYLSPLVFCVLGLLVAVLVHLLFGAG